MNTFYSTYAVLLKDAQSELRTRYAVNALVMFVVTAAVIVQLAIRSELPSSAVLSGLFWVVVFFAAMSGLSRTFVSEEERGTSMTLQLVASPSAVYFGKLSFNIVLTLLLNSAITILFTVVFPGFVVETFGTFLLTVLLSSIGLASTSTILAAIIAKANTKGTLYPVLAFPILIPLLMTAMRATTRALDGEPFGNAAEEYQILISYIMVITAGSYLVFDYVWKD
ncbi:MAG: heme exporter protein CcmB [Ignavibacteriae bacterium]|nr:heme exporter protein CcmB [Ignavibacteriota bacterium]